MDKRRLYGKGSDIFVNQQFEIFPNCSAHPHIAHIMKTHENVIIVVSSCLPFPTGDFSVSLIHFCLFSALALFGFGPGMKIS